MGKMSKTLFSRTMEQSTDLLEIIHTDVCGLMNVEARGGYRYFLTFTGDLSRYGYIVGERSNFKKFPMHTQDHGDA